MCVCVCVVRFHINVLRDFFLEEKLIAINVKNLFYVQIDEIANYKKKKRKFEIQLIQFLILVLILYLNIF